MSSPSSSLRRLRASDWSGRREQYQGVTKSFSVGARRSQCGTQMWKVIQHCESSQRTQAHACWFEMKSTRKSFFEAGHSK